MGITMERAGRRSTVRDGRTIRRWGAAVCMIIAPLGVALIRGIIPSFSAHTTAQVLAADRAHGQLYPVMAVAEIVVVLTMWGAMQGLGRLIQGRLPVLALIATPLATLGWTMVAVGAILDAVAYEMARAGATSAASAALLDRMGGNPTVIVLLVLFLVGHLLGTLLLGVGLVLTRRVPLWAGLAIIGGDLLHPVAYLGLHSQPLDVLAYVILLAGMTAAARTVLMTPDEAWDLPPRQRLPERV